MPGFYSVVRKREQSGFTLIEISIVLVILGLLIAPAVTIYHNYDKRQKWEKTEDSITRTMAALGGFRANHGRYPCPARINAVPGDADYGLEQCTADAVMAGSLPFKILNLEEREAYDGYLGRLNYAVTGVLTNRNTFDVNSGGISLVDESGDSLVTPPDSLHFIVVSSGENGAGSYSRGGAQGIACPAGTPEAENCNGDSVYRHMPHSRDFDDTVAYYTPTEISQWQISETNNHNIHLKAGVTGNVAVGVEPLEDVSGAESLVVRNRDEGGVAAVVPNPGFNPGNAATYTLMTSFNVDKICKYNVLDPNTDCFSPALIGGQIAHGGGLDCPPDHFLTGIKEGQPVCEPEVFLSCPDGQYIAGIVNDASGQRKLTCQGVPNRCAAKSFTPFCGGGNVTVPAGTGVQYAYSGTCYKLNNSDAWYKADYNANVTPTMTLAQKQAYVDSWNSATRTQTVCGPNSASGLVRDSYSCEMTAGGSTEWVHKRSHERFWLTDQWWSVGFNDSTSNAAAEQTLAYDGWPSVVDKDNNSLLHDCWCREDFKVVKKECVTQGPQYSGQYVGIQKVSCPNTHPSNRWVEKFTEDFKAVCICTPGPYEDKPQTCLNYFQTENQKNALGATPASGSVTGNVKKMVHKYCDGTPDQLLSVNTNDCKCPNTPDEETVTPCPAGTTNSYTRGGITGVQAVSLKKWICPTGKGGTVNHGSQTGYWTTENITGIPACVCNNATAPKIVEKACPPNTDGYTQTGMIKYEVKWDCSLNGGLGDWEPESQWTKVDDTACKSCTWKDPGGASIFSTVGHGNPKGSFCNCGSAPGRCHEGFGYENYNVWNSCTCVAQ